MTSVTQADCAHLLRLAGDLYNCPDHASTARVLLHSLMEIIPGEFGGCHLMRKGQTVVETHYDPYPGKPPVAHREFIRLIAEHPLNDRIFSNPTQAWRLTDAMSRAEFTRTAVFNELYRPIGIDSELTAAVPVLREPSAVLIVSLHRKGMDFSQRDRTMLNLLLPHVEKVAARVCTCRMGRDARSPERLQEIIACRTEWGLNPREVEVLYWLAEGKSNPEIGILLGISPRTAETHALNAYRKMGVENRFAAIVQILSLLRQN